MHARMWHLATTSSIQSLHLIWCLQFVLALLLVPVETGSQYKQRGRDLSPFPKRMSKFHASFGSNFGQIFSASGAGLLDIIPYRTLAPLNYFIVRLLPETVCRLEMAMVCPETTRDVEYTFLCQLLYFGDNGLPCIHTTAVWWDLNRLFG